MLTNLEAATLRERSTAELAAEFNRLAALDTVPDLDWFEALGKELVRRKREVAAAIHAAWPHAPRHFDSMVEAFDFCREVNKPVFITIDRNGKRVSRVAAGCGTIRQSHCS